MGDDDRMHRLADGILIAEIAPALIRVERLGAEHVLIGMHRAKACDLFLRLRG